MGTVFTFSSPLRISEVIIKVLKVICFSFSSITINIFILDGHSSVNLVEINKEAAMKWKGMSYDEKQRYQQIATQIPSPSMGILTSGMRLNGFEQYRQDNVRAYVLYDFLLV